MSRRHAGPSPNDLFGGLGNDAAFLCVRDDPHLTDEKQRCRDLWRLFQKHHLADPNFIDQISRHFHPRFWEMELAGRFLSGGHHLSSSPTGPDLLVDGHVRVEATVAERGTSADAIPRLLERDEDDDSVPFEQVAMRLISRLFAKALSDQAKSASGNPYVVAVNLPQAEAWICSGSPLSVQACWGADERLVVGRRGDGRFLSSPPRIRRRNGAPVPANLFRKEEFRHVSAVMVASCSPFRWPFSKTSEFFHNPRAKNPLPPGWYSAGVEYRCVGNTLRINDHEERQRRCPATTQGGTQCRRRRARVEGRATPGLYFLT